jgi:hypothetical protein
MIYAKAAAVGLARAAAAASGWVVAGFLLVCLLARPRSGRRMRATSR